MQTHLVFTVIAKDRPGLVERVAETIASLGGNWIESSMARLGGEFAGIVRVGIDAAQADDLTARLQALSEDGISITFRSDRSEVGEPQGASAQLDLVSQDHPGILRDITRVLSEQGVSIEHLETEVVQGSMQGEALFKATADLRLPAGLAPSRLSEALQETAADLMADIKLVD
ncbi:glycine cleavage system protein R [Roseibium aggregatum]|uniref:ACT domain-containing protein n=1 Tax=Roseibium aggregatum TaxID=187304 RepID=A0A939J272_9HYPH|nr:ACT domain-containing protein [Roseibium aggregatum]MBN9668775.1 ACT domain-containing protein [Roseibium aggregatum]